VIKQRLGLFGVTVVDDAETRKLNSLLDFLLFFLFESRVIGLFEMLALLFSGGGHLHGSPTA
jgi:hypothetical protein